MKFDPKDFKNTKVDFLYRDENVPKNQEYIVLSCVEPPKDLLTEFENFKWSLFMKKTGIKMIILENLTALHEVYETKKKPDTNASKTTNDKNKYFKLMTEEEIKLSDEKKKKISDGIKNKNIESNEKLIKEKESKKVLEELKQSDEKIKELDKIELDKKQKLSEKILSDESDKEKKINKQNVDNDEKKIYEKRFDLMKIVDKLTINMDHTYQEYKNFCDINSKEIQMLWNTYCKNKYGYYLTTDRMYIVHGVASSKKIAKKIANKVIKTDTKVGSLLIHEMGLWVKFNPYLNDVKDKKSTDDKMNELMHHHMEEDAMMQKYYETRRDLLLRESIENGSETKSTPGTDVTNMPDEKFNKEINQILFNNLPKKINLTKTESLVDKVKDIDKELGDFSVTEKFNGKLDTDTIDFVKKMSKGQLDTPLINTETNQESYGLDSDIISKHIINDK